MFHGVSELYAHNIDLLIPYPPQEAVPEVSKDKEPIGRRCGIELVRLRFEGFEFEGREPETGTTGDRQVVPWKGAKGCARGAITG